MTNEVERLVGQCVWADDEMGFWNAECGMEGWVFTDGGTPTENGMRFCHNCGRPIKQRPLEWDQEAMDFVRPNT